MDSDSDFDEGEVPPLLDAPPGAEKAPAAAQSQPSAPKVWSNQMPMGEEDEEHREEQLAARRADVALRL